MSAHHLVSSLSLSLVLIHVSSIASTPSSPSWQAYRHSTACRHPSALLPLNRDSPSPPQMLPRRPPQWQHPRPRASEHHRPRRYLQKHLAGHPLGRRLHSQSTCGLYPGHPWRGHHQLPLAYGRSRARSDNNNMINFNITIHRSHNRKWANHCNHRNPMPTMSRGRSTPTRSSTSGRTRSSVNPHRLLTSPSDRHPPPAVAGSWRLPPHHATPHPRRRGSDFWQRLRAHREHTRLPAR